MHVSIPLNNTMEYIDRTEISPLISHCNIKVCYVGQDPNRNGSVITKEVATELGRKMLGSPIVGFYNQEKKDFEGHNRELVINEKENSIEFIDTTKPYGFVPTDAKVWFQSFADDGIEHEYLCTEGYLWTTAYPESKRITEKGNNQSMELNDETASGYWANDNKTGKRFFIYNEALIEKLCVLGENVEPCFEGAQIKSEFSLENLEELRANMFSMISELQEVLKGGSSQMDSVENTVTSEVEEVSTEFAETQPEIAETVEDVAESFKKKDDDDEDKTDAEDKEEEDKSKEDEDDKKKKYELSEIPEYVELNNQYAELQTSYSALQAEHNELLTEVETLRQYKNEKDLVEKQAMIDKFYMLSDEDKKDVIDNINTYSLDDIEAKLSIIYVRNGVNFSLDNEKEEKENKLTFSLNEVEKDDAPAWIKAVRDNENN